MKSPFKFTALVVGGSLALLPVSMMAQSSNTTSGSTPAGSNPGTKPTTTDPQKPSGPISDPSTRPLDPKASGASSSADQTDGAGLKPGAANSGSGAGGRETMAPNATSPMDKKDATAGTAGMGSPWAGQFSTMDKDRDGRISATEFTNGLRTSTTTSGSSAATGTSGARDATGRTSSDGSSPNAGKTGMNSGASRSNADGKLFLEVDTNRDGYLSQAELDAYRMPKTSEE